MQTLSVVISAFNEEKKLSRVLSSVQWADEIIVVDNQSTDSTAQIAKQFGATVLVRNNNQMLNTNKNFGFEHVTKDWILNLDGDEEVTEALAKEIQQTIHENTGVNGFWIPRKNIIFGKWIQHGLWWPDKQLRLFKKGKGKFPCLHIHEYLSVEGVTENLKEPYIHYNYETVSQYLRKLDLIYTENEAMNLRNKGYTPIWHDAIRMPIGDFVKVFFFQEGYKDGLHGLVLSLLQAFYSLIVFIKVWEFEKYKEQEISLKEIQKELLRSQKEVRYWEKTAQLTETNHPIKKLLVKFQRKYVSNS